ncbi:MAG TPA: CBS domain-containing protein [Bacteroidales bacterium]|nr:CBS domain-containing protein [Bacteroidales bacterium]
MQNSGQVEKPNSEIFLETFTEIERSLKEICKNEFTANFSELLRKTRKINQVVSYYASDLKEFAQLRNAIVHTKRKDFIIAEPHPDVVQEVIHIRNLLQNPLLVKTVMKLNPYSVSPSASVKEVLTTFAEKGFMRCPIVDNGKIVGLLTAKTIARWLVNSSGIIDSTRVSQLLNYIDHDDYCIVSENIDIVSLIGLFNNSVQKGAYLQAALVTQNGKPDSLLVGIITPSDFPSIIGQLKVKH